VSFISPDAHIQVSPSHRPSCFSFLLVWHACLADSVCRAKNQRALNAKLNGSSLGAAGKDDALSTKAWANKLAKRNKRREQDLAERRQRDMEEADRAVYDESE